MEAILYICHGSRIPRACEEAISFVRSFMKGRSETIQEYGFLELAEPTIETAYQRCVEQGATSITAIPLLLLTAVHAKKDIPGALLALQRQYPNVTLQYGQPIGVHPSMVEMIAERIVKTDQPITKNSLILLVGRGSTDQDVKRDLQEIGRRLSNRFHGIRVEDCYLTAAEPSFQEMIDHPLLLHEADTVFIMPYLLFSGILMDGIKTTVKSAAAISKRKYVLCNYLGYDPKIEAVLTERIDERKAFSFSAY